MSEMVINHIIPAAIKYQTNLADNVSSLMNVGLHESTYKAQKELLIEISEHINKAKDGVDKMAKASKKADKEEHADKQAKAYATKVRPLMDKIREQADQLEYLVEDSEWPLVKYRELMFLR
jgi:glutamine synthetase